MTRADLHDAIDLLDTEEIAHLVSLVRALRADESDPRRDRVTLCAELVAASFLKRPPAPGLKLVIDKICVTVVP